MHACAKHLIKTSLNFHMIFGIKHLDDGILEAQVLSLLKGFWEEIFFIKRETPELTLYNLIVFPDEYFVAC
jgi:hypothetical protein